jgi:hypothetical protein
MHLQTILFAISAVAIAAVHSAPVPQYSASNSAAPSVLERRGTKSVKPKAEAHIVSRAASKAKHPRTAFELTAFNPLSLSRLNPITENIASEGDDFELSGGQNKNATELQLLAHDQANEMDEMKHVAHSLKDLLMMRTLNFGVLQSSHQVEMERI